MSTFHAFALAILQGITELFPISSLGHAVIVPALFGWPIDQHAPEFLPFVVVLRHVGSTPPSGEWFGSLRVLINDLAEPADLLGLARRVPAARQDKRGTHQVERLLRQQQVGLCLLAGRDPDL